jgi:hypothetical protein
VRLRTDAGVTWRERGRSTYSLVVDNLNYGSELPGRRAIVEEDNTADFDEPVKPVRISSTR